MVEEQVLESVPVRFEEFLSGITEVEEDRNKKREALKRSMMKSERNLRSPNLRASSPDSGASHWGLRSQQRRGVARDASVKQRLERDALVIVDALKKMEKEKEKDVKDEASKVESPRTAAEPPKVGGQEAAPPAPPAGPPPPPIAPPPPPSEKTRVNMLGSNSEEYYNNLFGVPKHVLESQSGLYRWRIENMQPVFIPEGDESGSKSNQFYVKDCYLILWVDAVPPEEKDKKPDASDAAGVIGSQVSTYNLHYWMGKETTSDKLGTVCVRAVQLNSFLSGMARHYPENQGEESALFLSYFEGLTLDYLPGGTESPFRKVEEISEYKEGPRLYRAFLVGDEEQQRLGKYYQIQRVELSTHWFSSNHKHSAEIFLLDTGLHIFQFNGAKSLGNFQFSLNDLALTLRTERHATQRTKIFIFKII